MKIAILSESSADDAAIKILIDAIIGEENELLPPPRLGTRGYPQVLKLLPSFFKYWYYQTEAEALVVIVDSDDDPIHQSEHAEEGNENSDCRLCIFRKEIAKIQEQITLPHGRERIKTAVGLSVPAIEAWFRCVEDSHITEATWARKLNGEKIGYDRKSLKKDVYGGERSLTKEKSIEAAQAIVSRLDYLKEVFPQGFGSLVKDIQSW